jgi:hypothetical protein
MTLRAAVLLVAFGVGVPSVAQAQDAGRGLQDVFVRSTDGVEIRAKLLELQPATLSVFVEGSRREIPLDSVDRIQARGDSVWNGAVIAASIAGALYGLAMIEYGTEGLPLAIAGTAGWSLLGAGVDALIPGRTTIYSKPPAAALPSGGRRAGLAVKFGF